MKGLLRRKGQGEMLGGRAWGVGARTGCTRGFQYKEGVALGLKSQTILALLLTTLALGKLLQLLEPRFLPLKNGYSKTMDFMVLLRE